MKKGIGILFAMAIFIGIPVAVKASGASIIADEAINSYGSIIYEDANGSVRIYADDIALLQEKLASIPDEIFDPVLYSHAHVWEYVNVTDQGHTKHCAICGSKYDVVSNHMEAEAKECAISYNGEIYQGYEKICECGYKWEEESYHHLIYVQKDETYHTISCALEGTSYCSGVDISDAPHVMILQPVDALHHQNICGDCGYQGTIEECVFEVVEDMDEELDLEETEGLRKYCACGNYLLEPETDVTDPGVVVPETRVTENEINKEQQDEFEKSEEQSIVSDTVKLPVLSVSENNVENGVSNMEITEEIIEREGED